MGRKKFRGSPNIQVISMHGRHVVHLLFGDKEVFVNRQYTTKKCRVCRASNGLAPKCRQTCGSDGPQLPLFKTLAVAMGARMKGRVSGFCGSWYLHKVIKAQEPSLVVEVGKGLIPGDDGVHDFNNQGEFVRLSSVPNVSKPAFAPKNHGGERPKKLSRKQKKAAQKQKTDSSVTQKKNMTYAQIMASLSG